MCGCYLKAELTIATKEVLNAINGGVMTTGVQCAVVAVGWSPWCVVSWCIAVYAHCWRSVVLIL